MKQAWAKFRGWPLWAQWVIGLVAVFIVFAALVPAEDDDEQPVSAGQAVTTTAPVVTVPPTPAPTTTTTVPPTTTTTATPKAVDIVTFSGSSTKNTETFAVRSPWRLQWTVTGGAGVGIEIYDQVGNRIEYISTDPGSDESVVRRACTCYLKLTPFGSSYTVTVNGVPA